MLKSTKVTVVAVALAGLMGAVTGCGTSQNAGNATSGTPNAKVNNPQTLVLYSAQGYDDAVAKAFQKETGIQVKLVDDSTGNIVAKMEAEKSNPHWDVAWFDGDSTMQSLDNEGMLMTSWTPQNASNLSSYGASLVPSDKAYYPTSITAAAAIGYNTKLVPADQAPKDWNDLLKPQFKNSVAMNDPSISGPTFPYVAGMLSLKGDADGKKFYSDLKQNGLKVFPTNDVTIKALIQSQVKAVTIQDSALVKAKVDGAPIQIVYPKSGAFSLPSVISIDKNAPNKDAAEKFVEFVLSKEGQDVMLDPKNGGGDSYFNPIITGVSANAARQQDGINWVSVNPVNAAKNMADIKKWFNENITH